MNGGRVTVVVPVYNDEQHLRRALDSVAAQTFGDWEAVVIDDASTDDSIAIANEFALRDPRFRALRLEQNVGVPVARNIAISASRGSELIALLDSDDYWRADYLEHMVGCYDQSTAAGRQVGVVMCNPLLNGPDGITGECWSDRIPWRDEIDYDAMIERDYVLSLPLLSRRAYDEVGRFSAECMIRDRARGLYAASDDYDMWLRMLEAGYEIVTTREPVAVYRINPGGRSWSPGVMARATIATYERALHRGQLTRRQRRAVAARIRHHQALVARAAVMDALAENRKLAAAGLAVRAAPRGLVAWLQAPTRWGEWLHLRAPRTGIARAQSAQ